MNGVKNRHTLGPLGQDEMCCLTYERDTFEGIRERNVTQNERKVKREILTHVPIWEANSKRWAIGGLMWPGEGYSLYVFTSLH